MLPAIAVVLSQTQAMTPCQCMQLGWLVVFNVPSTARSFRDGAPIYCPLQWTDQAPDLKCISSTPHLTLNVFEWGNLECGV